MFGHPVFKKYLPGTSTKRYNAIPNSWVTQETDNLKKHINEMIILKLSKDIPIQIKIVKNPFKLNCWLNHNLKKVKLLFN